MLDKLTFKICEAVHLGLSHYYMGPHDKRKLKKSDIIKAISIIGALPGSWWREKHNFDACRR